MPSYSPISVEEEPACFVDSLQSLLQILQFTSHVVLRLT